MHGPPTILDKSAFQALSHREHTTLGHYFLLNITPVLVLEVLGDLSKQYRDDTVPSEKVRELAQKFGGGEFTNEDYRFICVNTLLGIKVPLDGHIIPANASVLPDEDGSLAALVEDGPLDRLIRRLAAGRATRVDHDVSALWRARARGLSFSGLNNFSNRHQLVIPRVNSPGEAVDVARGLSDVSALQDLWLDWLLENLAVAPRTGRRIMHRWRKFGGSLRVFAPYAHYCLHALLSMFVAYRSSVVKWKSTNLLDLEYLYYLPFCTVFVSDDKIHRALAPGLMRPDQSFVAMPDFKAGLRKTLEFFEGLTHADREAVRGRLHDWPPEGSLPRELWEKNGRWMGAPPQGDPP